MRLSTKRTYLWAEILFLLGVAGWLFGGCFASEAERKRRAAMPFYQEALNRFLDGDLETAREKSVLATHKYPDFVEAHILYQRIRAKQLETKSLLKEYRKLMKGNPDNPNFIFLYARLLDDLDEQERLYKKITDIDKNCPWGYFGLGWVYYKRGQYDAAAEHFEQAVKLDPKNPLFHLDLGAAYYLMKHYRDAESELLKAAELAPKLVEVWYDLGTVYYQLSEYDKAVEALRKYVDLYPAAPDGKKVKKMITQLSGGRL